VHFRILDISSITPTKRTLYKKGKAAPLQAWNGTEGSRKLRFPDHMTKRHRMVVRLSALRTGRLNPQGNAPGTHFC
jgi:hypothetical protein